MLRAVASGLPAGSTPAQFGVAVRASPAQPSTAAKVVTTTRCGVVELAGFPMAAALVALTTALTDPFPSPSTTTVGSLRVNE